MTHVAVIFDLDDTLYPEADYVASAYRHIAGTLSADPDTLLALMTGADNAFDALHAHLPEVPIAWMVQQYREHTPTLTLPEASAYALRTLADSGCHLGIITEGREGTQQRKIAALGLAHLHALIVPVGAKATGDPFREYARRHPAEMYVYVGDNPEKDFAAPRRLGWHTVGLRDAGRNIHPCRYEDCPPDRCPDYAIDTLRQLPQLITQLSGAPQ